jgi:hypothetical protein
VHRHTSYNPVARHEQCIGCIQCNEVHRYASCSLSRVLAAQLDDELEKVQQAVRDSQPPPSTRFGVEMWEHWITTIHSGISEGRMAESDLKALATAFARSSPGHAAKQWGASSPTPAQPWPKAQQQEAAAAATAAAAAVSAPAVRQESVPPAAPSQLSLAEQQRAAAAESAAAAAADRMAQLLMVHSGCVTVCLSVTIDRDAREFATIRCAPILR